MNKSKKNQRREAVLQQGLPNAFVHEAPAPAPAFCALAALIGIVGSPVSHAAVNVIDASNFVVNVISPDTVVVDCHPIDRTVRVESAGAQTTYATSCQQMNSLLVDASLDDATVTIDVSGIDDSSVSTATITIEGSSHNDTLIGPSNTAGTLTISINGRAGDDTITVGDPAEPPAAVNNGTVTITAGAGNDNVSVWRRAQFPEATAANVEIDLGDGLNTLVVVSDNVDVVGGADTDDVTLCGCWGRTEIMGGDDVVSMTGFNNEAIGGAGNDNISIDAQCTATATLVTIAPPSSSATILVNGGNGADQLRTDHGDTASVTITVTDSGTDTATDTLTITSTDGSGGHANATTTLSVSGGSLKTSNANGDSALDFSGMESVLVNFSDQAGPDGDSLTLTLLSSPSYSLLIDGGLPDAGASPGDTIISSSEGLAFAQGFETTASVATIPLVGLGGLIVLAGSLSAISIKRRTREH